MQCSWAAVLLLLAVGHVTVVEPAGANRDSADECPPDGSGHACREAQVEAAEELAAQAMNVELLQRGLSLQKAPAEANNSAAEACSTSAIARMVQTLAPGCAAACPQLCTAVEPLVSRLQSGGLPAAEVCRDVELAECVAEHAAECAPSLLQAEALGLSVPRSAEAVEAMCTPSASMELTVSGAAVESLNSTEVSAGRGQALHEALRDRAEPRPPTGRAGATSVDQAVMAKTEDLRCAQAPEGQTCVALRAYIYCSNHKRLSAGETDCEKQQGLLSRCVTNGIGLQKGRCDDPFCRNGGAIHGDGYYCHKDSVVSCFGDAEPRIEDSCSARTSTYTWGKRTCRHTRYFQCVDGYSGPRCVFSYERDDCN